ncbi:MAG: hypothetical protein EAX90_13455 [Candidatus Heimdallarchaeota archaeon]|nr:hypothetical protein [Candidatus Heimdallarchaeota archaeon]
MLKDNFVRICGICSIIAAFCYIGTVIFSLIAGLGKPENFEAMNQYLQDWFNVKTLMSAYGWFGILGSLFTLPAILGYYQILRKEGPMQWIPAVIIFHGVLLLTLAYIIPIIISYDLAPRFVSESNPIMIGSILNLTFNLIIFEDFFVIIGTILTLATGLALIGILDLKKSILPKWLNIIAIVTGVLSFGLIGTLGKGIVKSVFNIVTIIDLSLMLIWMIIIGIIMILPSKKSPQEIKSE